MKNTGMKFSLWTDNGALNSKPIFDAFGSSLLDNGHTVAYNDVDCDVDVIWGVLWYGRTTKFKSIAFELSKYFPILTCSPFGDIHLRHIF